MHALRRTRTAALVLVLALNEGPAIAQKGPMNLESLIQQSGMIFAGKVVDIETGIKDYRMNLYFTYYTFQILEPVYGVEGETVRIKQYGGEANGKKFYPAGVPRFERGEEVVVMFYPTSAIGMTSTVGKDQGKFWIQQDTSTGSKAVSNKLKNKGLFRKLNHPGLVADPDWIAHQPDSIPYGGFLKTVRSLTGELKKEKRKR